MLAHYVRQALSAGSPVSTPGRGRALNDAKLATADEANSAVLLLGELIEVLLNPMVADGQVRRAIWQYATPQELQRALELAPGSSGRSTTWSSSAAATEPPASSPRGSWTALEMQATPDGQPLLAAVEFLRDLNRRGARRLPPDAPTGFVPRSWRPYVYGEVGGLERRHWELSAQRAAPRAALGGDLGAGKPPLPRPRTLPHLPNRMAGRPSRGPRAARAPLRGRRTSGPARAAHCRAPRDARRAAGCRGAR